MSNNISKRSGIRTSEVRWREVVLSGGGSSALGMLGALQWLHDHGKLKHVRRWVAASAGVIITILYLADYAPATIFAVLHGFNFQKFADDFNSDGLLGLMDTMGIMEPGTIMKLVAVMLRKKQIDTRITLEEFDRLTGSTVVITGYSLTRAQTIAFSSRQHPHMPLLTALRISLSIPILFRPVMYEDEMYIDGATIEHVPVRFAKYKTRSLVIHCCQKHPDKWTIPNDLVSFANQLHCQATRKLENVCVMHVRRSRPQTVLTVSVQRNSKAYCIDFGITEAAKEVLYQNGKRSARQWDQLNKDRF